MTVVFVHGVPETAAIWDGVRAHLDRDSIALALPGFGSPRPAGFASTMDEYAAWLRAEVEAIEGPVDLVGHDWGGFLTTRLATQLGDRDGEKLRSWVTDAVSFLDPGFEWHDFAKIWQTPGEGEAFWEGLRASPSDTAALLGSFLVPDPGAVDMAEAIDEQMCASILDLYRSAGDVAQRWGPGTPPPVPGLVVVGSADIFGDEESSRRTAARLGADVVALEGAGHWWPVQCPEQAAEELEAFWATLE